MLKARDIIDVLEQKAPPVYQEAYDNSGLLTGSRSIEISGVLVCLDCTEEVIDEAINKKCNLIIAHHPILFKGLKKLTGTTYVERAIIKAIKNNVAIYALHTNLDNVLIGGVNSKIASRLGLHDLKVMERKNNLLNKLVTFVPEENSDSVREALFKAGGGHIELYNHCSFNTEGTGTFLASEGANPYLGEKGELQRVKETKIELVFPAYLKSKMIETLHEVHPYETVAYDVFPLLNAHPGVGSGLIGNLPKAMSPDEFLQHLKSSMKATVIKYTHRASKIQKVAICGGSGSFLLEKAKTLHADAFVSSDFKYHEFFDAENELMVCDIGHAESEQFTPELIIEIIKDKFPNFAPVLAETNTNPVNYYY